VPAIRAAYDAEYARFYDRPVPGSDVEIMSYAVVVATLPDEAAPAPAREVAHIAEPARTQAVRDTVSGEVSDWAIHDRTALAPGSRIAGPAIVVEDETSTLVGPGWSAGIDPRGYIELVREAS